MFQSISIGSSNHIDFIRDKIQAETLLLQKDGLFLALNERECSDYIFWDLSISPSTTDLSSAAASAFAFKYAIANLVADLIISQYENTLIDWDIKRHYSYFAPNEREYVIKKTQEILNNSYVQKRKNIIMELMFTYLETEETLILDGFVLFRLNAYQQQIGYAIEQAVDEYLMEKEYDDFIGLLKYFVEIQEPKMGKIHILLEEDGAFRIYDEWDHEIKNDYLESFIIELIDNELNYEDLLISTLITIAPEEISLHGSTGSGNNSILDTVTRVFEQRVTICAGCSKCVSLKKQQEKP